MITQELANRASSFANDFVKVNPQYKIEVNDFYRLMISEIEEGGSPQQEYDSFVESINQLLILEE